jgi:hypothetical protein
MSFHYDFTEEEIGAGADVTLRIKSKSGKFLVYFASNSISN